MKTIVSLASILPSRANFRRGAILRFRNPSEVKTSPKSWRRLSLLDLAGGVLMDGINKRRHRPNGDKRWFPAGSFSDLSLRACRKKPGSRISGRRWDMATISSRILKTSILAVAVTAIGIAILSVGNPVALVANVTDWWVDKPALQPEADPATSTIQTIAGTQDLPTTTTDAPPRDEIAAAVEPADQARPRPVRGKPRAVSAKPSQQPSRQPATH